MHFGRSIRAAGAILALCTTVSLVGAASTSAASSPRGTITYAEAAGANPNYIFPFMSCAYASENNINQFQQLMYRPLYWFGLGASSSFVPSLSLAKPPVFNKTSRAVTITLKGWKFADGQAVNARSVMFFLNMFKANPTSYCGYTAGLGIPDQVSTASGRGDKVTIIFNRRVNPKWMLGNFLSEITPMPDAWDRTSARGRGHCATGGYNAASTKRACVAVQTYLDSLATSTATFSGAMWQSGADGPWRLTKFDAAGNATFRANAHYSGPRRAQVKYVKEVAFTTATAEVSRLEQGGLNVGYIDPSMLTSVARRPGAVGSNIASLAGRYRIDTGSPWAFNYAPFNFNPAVPGEAATAQHYIRQALQMAVDQPSIIASVFEGYGYPITTPLPPSTSKSIVGKVTNPYPFNLNAARALLTSHGWTLQADLAQPALQVMTCSAPGTAANQCGAGIPSGFQLNFKIVWTSGTPALDAMFNMEIAEWSSIGVVFTHTTDTSTNVIADCSSATGDNVCSWGTGWNYAPSNYPSGESLFTSTGDFNTGAYANPQMSALITGSIYGGSDLTAYARFAAADLPVLYEPLEGRVVEIDKRLKSNIGFAPNPLGNFMPEYLHF